MPQVNTSRIDAFAQNMDRLTALNRRNRLYQLEQEQARQNERQARDYFNPIFESLRPTEENYEAAQDRSSPDFVGAMPPVTKTRTNYPSADRMNQAQLSAIMAANANPRNPLMAQGADRLGKYVETMRPKRTFINQERGGLDVIEETPHGYTVDRAMHPAPDNWMEKEVFKASLNQGKEDDWWAKQDRREQAARKKTAQSRISKLTNENEDYTSELATAGQHFVKLDKKGLPSENGEWYYQSPKQVDDEGKPVLYPANSPIFKQMESQYQTMERDYKGRIKRNKDELGRLNEEIGGSWRPGDDVSRQRTEQPQVGVQTQPTEEQYEIGKLYQDANGNKAKYLGNSQWEEQK